MTITRSHAAYLMRRGEVLIPAFDSDADMTRLPSRDEEDRIVVMDGLVEAIDLRHGCPVFFPALGGMR